ncbi:MAG: cytochrome c3 family protein [Pirellulaceae bacterium]
MKRNLLFFGALAVILSTAYAMGVLPESATDAVSHTLDRSVNPGTLSTAHANLADNCQACHTPVMGVDTAKCILCHANNTSILQRQPTAFHASVGTCKQCHLEHRGLDANLSEMDHSLLTLIGMEAMQSAEPGTEEASAHNLLVNKLMLATAPHERISLQESVLDCASCHSNDDQHQSLFGNDCAQCHATDRWTIPEYKHPSTSSTDCNQCHQAPPSHYMMHFKMISATVAGKPHARVERCHQCHQTTSWNDIQRVGWYKHH